MKKKIICFITSMAMLFCTLLFNSMPVSAICCRKDGFDKSKYTLTGNMAEDVATIAKSQEGRTRSDFGYTEAWCDEFVADCIENAGADSSIVGHGGTVADFEAVMRKKGAVPVSSPQIGDLVFFTKSHVEIVTKIVNGVVYCAGGNNGGGEGYCRPEHPVSYTGTVRLYLRPNYKNFIIEPPIVKTTSKSYIPDSNVEITWNTVSGATGYWIDIWKDGEGFISQNLGNVNSYVLNSSTKGNYGVFVTAYKDDGNWQSACSECWEFEVKDINAPSVYTYHTYYAPNADIDITWDTIDNATGYWIDIWKDGEGFISQHLGNTTSYTFKEAPIGNYGVFITAFCENGGWSSACSNVTNFYVGEVSAPDVISSSEYYTPNSEATILWNKIDNATGYWIDIWKDGEHIFTQNIGDTLSYAIPNVETGKYDVFIASFNDNGGWTTARGEACTFYVKDAPSKPELKVEVDKNNSKMTWNKCSDTDYYAIHIIDADTEEYYNYIEPYEDTSYEEKLPMGNYRVSVASVQKNGFFTFSDEISFKIEKSSVVGDVNADGEFSIADVVLLQKWLLAVPDIELADWTAGDLCKDDKLNVFDLCVMKQKLLEVNK